MNKLTKFGLLLCFLSFVNNVYAACSDYAGRAVINELYAGSKSPGPFVEIKILDNSISSSVYNDWSVTICNDTRCDTYAVGTFINNYPWIYSTITTSHLSFHPRRGGFDVMLKDGANNPIDYFGINGYSTQSLGSCSTNDLPYYVPSISTTNGTKLLKRDADGTGVYDVISANEGHQTPGSDNEGNAPSVATLQADFRYDECTYTGAAGEVIDQTGSFNATTSGASIDKSTSVVNHALDLTSNGTTDWQSLPNGVIDGLDSLSMSFWLNTSVSKSQQEIFQALGSDANDDELEVYIQNSNQIVVKIKDDAQVLASGISLTNGIWHHVALTRDNDRICLFVDGSLQECETGFNTGALSVPNANGVVIGQEQDSYGGSFTTSQNFVGWIDEFKIYQGVVSADQVSTIYGNESAGLNYDASVRAEVSCVLPVVVDYRFDECEYVGDPNEVIDQTGNFNTDGSNLVIEDSTALFNNALDLSADGTNDWLNVSSDVFDGLANFSLSFWVNTTVSKSYQGILHVLGSNTGDDELEVYLVNDQQVNVAVRDRTRALSSGVTLTDGQWHHLAITRNGSNVCLFVDGAQQSCTTSMRSGNIEVPNANAAIIGQEQDSFGGSFSTGQSSRAKLDEFKVFAAKLTADEVSDIYTNEGAGLNYDGSARDAIDCGAEPIFQIIHDGSGITCLTEQVQIKTCTDATCTTTDTSVNTTINLLVNGGSSQTINIAGGLGSATFNYTDTVNNAILSSSVDYLCTNTSLAGSLGQTNADCGLSFSNTGLVIDPIPNQIAGVGFSGLTIQAVQADETGACSALFDNTTDIGFAMQYQNPTTLTSNDYTINGTPIIKSIAAPSSYTPISIDFNASGVGIIPTNIYYDAGQVQLHAQKIIPATADLAAVTLTGNSNNFWVRPDKFVITSPLAGAAGIYPAGDDFNYEVNAVNRQGITTTNYQPFDVEASIARVAPTSGDATNGDFTFSDPIGSREVSTAESFVDTALSFTGGIATVSTAEYSEVGIVSLDVRDHNYGGIGLEVDADAVNLGRFTPKYFTQTVSEHGNVIGSCGAGNWAYSGQLLTVGGNGAITYGDQPELLIVAKNSHGITTENYRNFGAGDNFNFLTNTSVTTVAPTQDLKVGADATTLYGLSGVLNTGTLSQRLNEVTSAVIAGEFTYQLSSLDHFVYTRDNNAVTNPFTAEFDISIASIIDGDGVTALTLNDVEIRSDVEVRFGRLVLDNSYGPESENLSQPFTTEYLTDVTNMTFTTSIADDCTTISDDSSYWLLTNGDTSNGLTASDINVVGSSGTLSSGQFNGVELQNASAPIVQGSVNVEYVTFPWLQFDWDNDGTHDNNANAVATFGRYRGNDRIIYWKEINN